MNEELSIAICLSGEPRYYERCIPGIQQLRNHPNVKLDVFYHLWDNITKRQKEIREEPVLSDVDTKLVEDKIQPTHGIFENKDSLNPYIEKIYIYCKKLIETHNIKLKEIKNKKIKIINIVGDKDLLASQIKYTNTPWYSQIYSMCKSHMIRIQYEKDNNMYYDFVLRSRTDVELVFKNINKLLEIKNHPTEGKSGPRTNIYFPSLYIKGSKRLSEQIKNKKTVCLPIHVEYCYFVGNSKTLSEDVFKNYKQDIMEYMLQVKDTTIFQPTSHTFMPFLLLKYTDHELRSGTPSINCKLTQMPNLELNE